MKRSWAALAVTLVTAFAVGGCNDYGNTFQNNTGALLTFLSPSQVQAGSGGFSLLANGSGFVPKTVVYWNGKALPTTVALDSNGNVLTVTATVAASLVASAGVANVYTLNPQSGTGNNGLSNIIAFNINPPPNPTPVLNSLSPNTSPASTSSSQTLTITLTGSGFVTNSDPTQASQVQWSRGGTLTNLQVAMVTSTSIQATVTGGLLTNTSSSSVAATVSVFNPPSPPPTGCTTNCTGGGGGGSSNPVTFTICAAGQSSCAPLSSAKDAALAAVAEETPAVSLDGRFVSYAAVQNGLAQVFLRDTCEGAPAGCQAHTTLLSVAPDDTVANDESHSPSMSADGRYVAFSSAATNLVDNASSGRQIYLRDTCAGASNSCKPATQLVSVDPNGALVGTESILPSVSSSGRFVAFLSITPSYAAKSSSQAKSSASVANSGNRQVFVRDTCLGVTNCTPKTTRISLQPGDGSEIDSKPAGPALSGQASHVAVSGGNAATLFTRSVAIDDRVFLAITNGQR
jgi:hypothetical protein